MAAPGFSEEERKRLLREDIGNLNIRNANRTNIIRGLERGTITDDSARRIVDDINAEQSGIRPPPIGPAPPVQAGDPNTEERTAIRNIFNRAGVSDNREFPANAEAPFTAPAAPRDPENLSAVAQALNDGQMDEIVSTASRSDVVDPSVSPIEQIVAELQPELDIPPPDFSSGFDENGFPVTPPGGRELAFGGVRDLAAEGFAIEQQPGTAQRFLNEANELIAGERLAQEEFGAEGAERAGEDIQLAARRGLFQGRAVIRGVGAELMEGIRNVARPVAEFARGLAGPPGPELDGPPTVHAAEVEDAAGEPTGSQPVDDQGELSAGDAAEVAAQENATGPLEAVSGTTEPVSTTLTSDQPGVESTPSGSAADRILGPPLASRADRGEGVDVIRALRQTFQPTDAGGQATGAEIPFGRGTLQRLENLGATFDEAVDFGVKIEAENSKAINAGAQSLIARRNAMIPMVADFNGDGEETNGFVSVQPDGSIQLVDSTLALSLTQTMKIVKRPISVTGSTGLPETAQADMLVKVINTPQGPVEIPFGTLNTAADTKLIEENAALYEQFRDQLELAGHPNAHRRAIEMVRESVDIARQ